MKNILIFIAFLFLLSSCGDDFFDQVVEVDVPEHESALAITSTLTSTDSILWAYVTKSVGILDPENPGGIENATVEIFRDGALLQSLPHVQEGYYGFQIPGIIGNETSEYELRVSAEGFESVRAVQQMPSPISLTEATYEKDGTVDIDGQRVDEIVLRFSDNADEKNYYTVQAMFVFEDIEGRTYENPLYLESNDPSFQYTFDGLYFNDGVFNGNDVEFSFYTYGIYGYDEPAYVNKRIEISLSHVTADRYFREISVYNYDPENPFAEPTIIYSNIENGYGIFSLAATGPTYVIEL